MVAQIVTVEMGKCDRIVRMISGGNATSNLGGGVIGSVSGLNTMDDRGVLSSGAGCEIFSEVNAMDDGLRDRVFLPKVTRMDESLRRLGELSARTRGKSLFT